MTTVASVIPGVTVAVVVVAVVVQMVVRSVFPEIQGDDIAMPKASTPPCIVYFGGLYVGFPDLLIKHISRNLPCVDVCSLVNPKCSPKPLVVLSRARNPEAILWLFRITRLEPSSDSR